jgi:hypothetical protein
LITETGDAGSEPIAVLPHLVQELLSHLIRVSVTSGSEVGQDFLDQPHGKPGLQE